MEPSTPPDQAQAAKKRRKNPFAVVVRSLWGAASRLIGAVTSAYKRAKGRGRGYWRKQLVHWGGVAILIAAGIWVGRLMEHHHIWLRERYSVTQGLHDFARWISGKEARDKHSTVVLIGDEEFWGPELAGRNPVSREYLSRLVQSLGRFEPRVIALDFYLSSPRPDGSVVIFPNYETETRKLFEAVGEVGSHRPVILLRSVGFRDGYYVYESDTYNENTFAGKKVSSGHVYFENDYRLIPMSLVLRDGTQVNSFSEAIVGAYDMSGMALDFDEGDDESLTYGEYLRPDKINKYSATQVMHAEPSSKEFTEIADKVGGKVVIVGGSWHQRAFGRGPMVDQHSTPVGEIPGVYMHANYVEALLDTRYYRPLPEKVLIALEVLLGLATAIIIAREFWWVWRVAVVVALIVLVMLSAVVSLQILGSFFDFFIPVITVIGHALYEQVKEWRSAAIKSARKHPA
jgi:CHASE2 domain-containing sensor protein